ncbi:hypothetical protein SAMN06265795_11828 [Noviherbaspirillum humi]|uniref:Transmembrane protein n=1 Tax=Noviherbaspirillum humi TaxID=1688639 RepID=A0A239KZR0_9BURK|nr:hypothetical protein [Noviherbaspirillum humi]SNT23222.1 hypothetical protein SAMN06265795_11828 [Noviherbaspirillum humi]
MESITPARLDQGVVSTNENPLPSVASCQPPDNKAAIADMEQGAKGAFGGLSLTFVGALAKTPPLSALGILFAFLSFVNFGRGYTERKPNPCNDVLPKK